MGQRVNELRVMVKPLAGGRIDDYLALVPATAPGNPDQPSPAGGASKRTKGPHGPFVVMPAGMHIITGRRP